MTGRWARDLVCLTVPKCVELDFLYIDEQDFLPANAGAVFGFARPDQPMQLDPTRTPKDRDFYLAALTNQTKTD